MQYAESLYKTDCVVSLESTTVRAPYPAPNAALFMCTSCNLTEAEDGALIKRANTSSYVQSYVHHV